MRKSKLVLLALLVGGILYLVLSGPPLKPRTEDSPANINPTNLGQRNGEPPVPPGTVSTKPRPVAAVMAAAPGAATGSSNATSGIAAQVNDDGKISSAALEQIAALQQEKEDRSPAQRKIDSQLLFAGKMSRNEPIAQGVPALQVELDHDANGRVLVDIKAKVSPELLAEIERRGGKVINSFAEYRAVRAAMPLAEIEGLGGWEDVQFIGPAVRAERRTGSVTSEGDTAENASTARSTFHVTGAGVQVAVLSDSDDYREESQALGDLGPVTVLPGQDGRPGSGEGTAMLEIVHDLAPGATLYYASAFGGVASFANNIRQLRAAGCDIIIDDVGYLNESPFQDGPIAQAVNDVTAAGALFFSSAGNSGNKTDSQSGVWEGDFADGGQAVAPITRQGHVHSFGAANYNTVGSGGSSRRVDLFWADPLGHAADDYDVYILDASGIQVVAASNNTQDGHEDPYESINKLDAGQRLVVVRYAGAARYLNLSTGRGRLGVSTGGQTRGHNSAAAAFCVAAVSAHNATASFNTANKVETFSSDGPRRIFFNPDGTAITPGDFSSSGGTVRQKPDIAAADGVKTTLPGNSGLNPFYGTSAAAPHAGAIAALLKSYRPGLSPAELRAALIAGALDIEAAGIDHNAGFGLVMADRVLQAAGVTQPPSITGFSPGSGPVGNAVTITGTKFAGATTVTFNGASATFNVISAGQINATVPTGAATGAITVTTPDGTATSATAFTVAATSAITALTPSSGSAGTLVIITGANLGGATAVSFNGAAATFTVNSSTQITAIVPAAATTGKVAVTTPSGTAQSPGVFTVSSTPVISSFTPGSGAAGTSVIISGANFVNVTSVKFNGVAVAAPTVNSSSRITAAVPAGATSGPITVTTSAGTVVSGSSFVVVQAPAITGFSPTTGGAGTVVILTGSGFAGAAAVTFNGANAANFTVGLDTQITATAPAGVSTGPIRVIAPGGTASSPAVFTAITAPGNDNFAAAQVLSGGSGSVSGNNQGATKQTGEPDHAGNSGGRSVWYKWTAPSGGTWSLDTVGSSFDTLLAVYTGSSLATLSPAAYNDDISDGIITNSRLAFVAAPGANYYIAVDGWWGGAQSPNPPASGTIKLNWAPSAAVPAITGFSPTSGTLGSSVVISGANFTGATSVSFNGVSAGFLVNSGTQITATVPAGAASGPLMVTAPGGSATSAGMFTVAIIANNDNFANAQAITGNSGSAGANNSTATKELGEPAHAGNNGGKSVWFAWTSPATGVWTFDTAGSSFDTLLAVYTGSGLSAITPIASNDDADDALTSKVAFSALAGTTYRIAVDGYSGDSGQISLNWLLAPNVPVISSFAPTNGTAGTSVLITGLNLNSAIGVKFNGLAAAAFANNSSTQIVASVPAGSSTGPITVTTSNGVAQSSSRFFVSGLAPANDNFAQRIALSGAIKTITGSNLYATKEAGEPDHAGSSGGSSVWWTWTAPSNGTYSVSTRNSDFDTLLGIYTGTSLAALAPVASNDDGQNMDAASLASFNATAGTAYQIAVDGYRGAAGNIVLSIFPVTPSQEIYYTGFEPSEGFSTNYTLAGQGGWQKDGDGQNGVVYNYLGDFTQQGYLGVSTTRTATSEHLWPVLNLTPNTNTRPVVIFSTYLEVVDSSNSEYDDFGWDFYNAAAQRLFFLDFDNYDLHIYYLPNDGSGYHDTGATFQNGQIYYLEVTLDFGRNRWSATLDGNPVVASQPISAASSVARTLGDIDVTWLISTTGSAGNNYMLFDDYFVTAEPKQSPRIITPPQNQSVVLGGSASFMVVVDSPLAVSYQWLFNGTALAGETNATLSLGSVYLAQAGNYSVTVSNTAGVVTSAPATLTVVQLPNLAPYQPGGWSDMLVVAAVAGTNDTPQINDTQNVFVSWAVENDSASADITNRFYTQLYLDGVLNHTWYSDGLRAAYYTYVIGYNLGPLAAGTHTLRLDTDATGVVRENDETDNRYTRVFLVNPSSGSPPHLGTASRGADGVFHFSLSGVPSRSYEIQTSTNLLNWSVLGTLLNTNPAGLLDYADPTATNANRRFYRGRLVSP